MLFAFGDCVIDPGCFELRRRGKAVKLEPKVFDVLIDLIERRDRVVTKQELLDRLWPGEAVSDSVLPRCIAAIRRAVGDTRTSQRVIATAHGRGYRFVAALEEVASVESSGASKPGAPSALADAGLERAGDSDPTLRSDFVGRGETLERLAGALERVQSGRGAISFLVGEPGIGKTRLAEEIAARASASGFEVLVGRCYEGEGAPAYWPWIQVLRDAVSAIRDDDALRALAGAGAADLADLVPELRMRIPEIGRAGGPDGEQARFRLYDAANNFLSERARRKPVLLILDDLHWSDASSLGLLRFMAGQISRAPILVVATYRDVDVRRGHPLADLLGALAREAECDRILLAGFGEGEIAALVRQLTGEVPRADFVTTLHEMTEGNPFFVREILRLIADREDHSVVDAAQLHALELPQGVRDAVGRRLDGLSSECNEMLRAAAVIGRSFRISILAEMVDLDDSASFDGLLELLGEALDASVIVESTRGSYAFDHALTRQTLYEELRAPQRIGLHRRAGEALERSLDRGRVSDEGSVELAHHFFEAAPGGDVDKAVGYAITAAEIAHRKHAYDEAVSLYERALEVLSLRVSADEARRTELTLALGEARFTAGKREQALATLADSVELARGLGRTDLMARAAIAIRGFGELGSPAGEEVTALVHECLEALPEDEDRLRSRLVSRLGGASAGSMAERDSIANRALELARRSGDTTALRDAWFVKWWASLGPDRVSQRYEVVRALRALAEQTGDLRTRLLALEVELGADMIRGDFEATERNLEEYERVAGELRQPLFVFMGMSYRTSWLINRGYYVEAESRVEEAHAYGQGLVRFADAMCMGQLHWSRSTRGVVSDLHPAADELDGLLRHSVMEGRVETLFLAMLHESVTRDVDAAYASIRDLDYRNIDHDEHWLLAMTSLADIATGVGDREMTAWLFDSLLPYRDLIAIHDLLRAGRGAVASTIGQVAAQLGELDTSIENFEHAIEIEAKADMRHSLAVSRAGLAEVLERRSGSGDASRAAALRSQAIETVDALGLGPGSRLYGLRKATSTPE